MGYISKDIAVITEPKIVSLSALPNFVQFASKPAAKTYTEVKLTVKVKTSSNLLNPNTITDGYYIGGGGNPVALSGYGVSDYIPVKPGMLYTGISGYVNAFRSHAFYNADKVYIPPVHSAASNTFTPPANAAYVRVSLYGPLSTQPRPYSEQGVFLGARPSWQPWAEQVNNIEQITKIEIAANDGSVHLFSGSTDTSKISGNVFFVSATPSDTAENIRQALINDPWINANFEILIPFIWEGGNARNGDTLFLKSKGAGVDYEIQLKTDAAAFNQTWISQISINNDSISGEASTAEVDLDVYINPDVFLGEDDRPINSAKIGEYLTTLSKTYAGAPVWFELNALFSQYPKFNLPSASGWGNTGTISVYRFVAKVKAVNSFAFYQSNALYVVNGYGRVSEDLNLDDYVYSGQNVKLLTNKPTTPYIKGQKEYLNFLFKDDQRDTANPVDFTLRIIYRAYTTSGEYLGAIYEGEQTRGLFDMANNFALNIDQVLETYPRAGRVKVALSRGEAIVSNDLEYTILPQPLHTLTQFTFLNRLGGWDSVNLDGKVSDEMKPESATYNKTLTPAYRKGDSIETVYATKLDTPVTIESAPLFDDVAEWLKELAASRAILNNDGEYIIIEDFELKRDPSKKNMQTAKIKYRLSETYTND